MASSSTEDNNNKNDSDMGFEYRGGEMRSGSMLNNNYYKSSSGFGSGWDPLGGSGSSVGLETHYYESGSSIGDLVPRVGGSFPFGNGNESGSFSEMVNPFCNHLNPASSLPNTKRITNGENGGTLEKEKKKRRIEEQIRGKEAKENSDGKDKSYIHVRAKRGQATNSHSLAERVRRERISERMKLLQELVPGCNKITGKAVMLDEIINYVQSLQQQVEFLSMKLATVNPEVNVDTERLVLKDILHSQGSSSNSGYGFGHSYPHPALHPNFIHP